MHIPASRIGEMIYAKAIFVISLAIFFSIAESSAACKSQFIGRMEIFDYAVFKTESEEFYTFELKGESAKKLYFEEFTKHKKRYEVLCLEVSFDGYKTGKFDFNRYEVVNIESFHYIRHVDCPKK